MSYPYYTHNNDEDQDDDNDRFNRKGSATTPNDFNPTFYNPFEIKHRRRISREQFKKLEKAFSDNPKPNGKVRQKLAEHVSMTPRGVQVWFQNRRAKAKQQKENKQKQEEMHREQQTTSTAVNAEPVLFSAYNMIHSRSQSSSSTFSCSDSLPNSSSFGTIADDKNLIYPIITSQTWHSDASTVTAVDEDDVKMLNPPFTPVQTQMSAETDFSWMDNADSMVFQTPNMNEQQFKTKNQGDNLLDAWAYITPNNSRYLGNELAYNRNVADWIKTVSLSSGNMELGNVLTNKKHSFEQDSAYWAGQQIMRRLSEPARSELGLAHSYLGNQQYPFKK